MDYKKEFAKFNIDTAGVCSAAEYNRLCRTDYKVCIVAIFPYFCGYEENSNLSIYTHGIDYHLVTGKILTVVAENLGLEDYRIHADTGPEIERKLVVEAGLAFLGKNGMAINEKYGSYFFVGYIVCNEDLPLSQPNTKKCAGCNKCIENCPGNALGKSFDDLRCLSAITQKKGVLAEWEKNLICENKTVFGCDVCQRVCPHNAKAEYSQIPEFTENKITRLTRSDVEGISNREFKEKIRKPRFQLER